MPGVQIDCRQPVDDRIHVGNGHEDFDLITGQRLGHRQLIEVLGIDAIRSRPRASSAGRECRRCPPAGAWILAASARAFAEKSGRRPRSIHGLACEFLQDGAGLGSGGIHGVWGPRFLIRGTCLMYRSAVKAAIGSHSLEVAIGRRKEQATT